MKPASVRKGLPAPNLENPVVLRHRATADRLGDRHPLVRTTAPRGTLFAPARPIRGRTAACSTRHLFRCQIRPANPLDHRADDAVEHALSVDCPYLTGFLRSRGFDAVQEDLALALVLRLLSRDGLNAIRVHAEALPARRRSESVEVFLEHFDAYRVSIAPTISFLQGRDTTLAHRICSRHLPARGVALRRRHAYMDPDGGDPSPGAGASGSRASSPRSISTTSPTSCATRSMPASNSCATPNRWRRVSQVSDPLARCTRLAPTNLVDEFSPRSPAKPVAPRPKGRAFPGVSGASPGHEQLRPRYRHRARRRLCQYRAALELAEPRVFDHFDYVTLDDGERPLSPCSSTCRQAWQIRLVRTYRARRQIRVGALRDLVEPDVPFAEVGTPTWDGCRSTNTCRCSTCSTQCTACGRTGAGTNSPWPTAATGRSAASATSASTTSAATTAPPPACWSTASRRSSPKPARPASISSTRPRRRRPCARSPRNSLRRGVAISWWGNIRFEKVLHPELCQLLADSGCIAISGGLEVASDRLLQADEEGRLGRAGGARHHAFTEAGVLVHAYLMYGFPPRRCTTRSTRSNTCASSSRPAASSRVSSTASHAPCIRRWA